MLVLLMAMLFNQCSVKKYQNIWKVYGLKTNYIQKGILDSDYFVPPSYLLENEIEFTESRIIISNIRKIYAGSALASEFGDTIQLERKILFQRYKDDDQSIQYPGDELIDCILESSDTCKVSNHFLNILETKKNNLIAYLSEKGKLSKTRCILFVIKEDRKMVLYNENDFLLLFLAKD